MSIYYIKLYIHICKKVLLIIGDHLIFSALVKMVSNINKIKHSCSETQRKWSLKTYGLLRQEYKRCQLFLFCITEINRPMLYTYDA